MVKFMNKVGLIILDGVGYSKQKIGNAVMQAKMPNFKKLIKKNSLLISASGTRVGLPSDEIAGNSEVGHNTLGAGKIYKQGLSLVDDAFKNKSIFKTEIWQKLIDNAKNKAIHFVGLLSDAFVHGNIKHLEKLITECKNQKIKKVYVHALLDGRDVAPQSGVKYLKEILKFLEKTDKNYKLVDFAGRNTLVMDRYEANTDIVSQAFNVYVNKNANFSANFERTIKQIYSENKSITDENIQPFILDKKAKIENGDSVVLYNFRGDRALEFAQMFDSGKYISGSDYSKIKDCVFAGMMQYDGDLKIPKNFLVKPPQIKNTLTEFLIENNIKQYSVTETQKFGHITYYFNGNRKEKLSKTLETYKEIKSDKGITFDEKPEMKAEEITKDLCNAFQKKYVFYKTNFANGDMVGHTGNLQASIKGLEKVDECLGKILKCAKQNNVSLIILADHGNCEKMINSDGSRNTSHTNNKVWCTVVNNSNQKFKLKKGKFGLSNIASSICKMIGLDTPNYFDESIIK